MSAATRATAATNASAPAATPAVDAGFVEVRPGVWIRASAVDVVEWVSVDSTNKSRLHTRADAIYLSPYPGADIRAALALAARCEQFATLELRARLAQLYGQSESEP